MRTEIRRSELSKYEIRNCNTSPDTDVINAVSRYEVQGYMTNTLLRDTDQMSMAHALEVRVPFVDPIITTTYLGFRDMENEGRTAPKPMLVDALGELLPKEISAATQNGFHVTFQRWLRSVCGPNMDELS